jgi:hypothetical protein
MQTDAPHFADPAWSARLVRAGVVTGVLDGLFSSVLSVAFYHSTVARLFQGVASTLLGPAAIGGGARPAIVGVVMHFAVAFGWSAVFLALYLASRTLRAISTSTPGVLAVASVYGALVWVVMSLIVIPLLLHRPAAITVRWWVQLIGHVPFVALPIVAIIGAPSTFRRNRGLNPRG